MLTVYYDSRTGNVKRFVNKLSKVICVNLVNINKQDDFDAKGHFITYTTGLGEVPITTDYFLQRFSHLILSVACSGNRNWGKNYAIAGEIISNQYNIDLIAKFELSGLNSDVANYAEFLRRSML